MRDWGPRAWATVAAGHVARRRMARRAFALCALALSSCDEATGGPDAVLVDAVAELHLADAVAEADSLDPAAAQALRRQALARHGLDSAALGARLRELAGEPDALGALYDSVALRLTLERQGIDRSRDAEVDSTEM